MSRVKVLSFFAGFYCGGGDDLPSGRPKKRRIKIRDVLKYVNSLPDDSDIKKRLTPEKILALQELVEQLEYLGASIVNLKRDIAERGEVEEFVQGNQKIRRVNPAMKLLLESYRMCRHTYSNIVEILGDVEIRVDKYW